ncbi:STY4851/ECs_5259 family protein [Brevundimonas sp.]|uniref:STY4851/ECs_5259 family protein n=1 Tax=Brevundimonas sp. TaxID=1871086 RepID=UPI0028A1EB92|nr:STY4851/ECs_5259 family protein [Brevundimonas sp.]
MERNLFEDEFARAVEDGDSDKLKSLKAALANHTGDWVRMAQMRLWKAGQNLGNPKSSAAVVRQTQIAKPVVSKISTSHSTLRKPVERETAMHELVIRTQWLEPYGIKHKLGQPLYRYHLSSEAFSKVEADLRACVPKISVGKAADHDAALFVLWAAEWFRKNFKGGMRRWEDVGLPLKLRLDQAGWRRLADRGLRYWGLPELKQNGMHYRLAAIARQGGFPVAAVAAGQGGWASLYMKKLVAGLLSRATVTQVEAEEIAQTYASDIPDLWRSEQMFVVAAELAIVIVGLRREAEQGGVTDTGLVSAWLDERKAGWRDTLPVSLDLDGASQLVDDLIKVERLKGGHDAIRARRYLVNRGGQWSEMAELEVNGLLKAPEIASELDKLASEWSRLRLFASSEAAQYISTELAIAEPTEDGAWKCMPSRTQAMVVLPFNIPLHVELRGEGQRVAGPFIMPGGEACLGDLRICVPGNEQARGLPRQLEVVGKGSGGYRAEPVYLDIPDTWNVVPRGEDSACNSLYVMMAEGRSLWEVVGDCLVETDQGDTFLVRAGQQGDQRDVISLSGNRLAGWSSADGRDVFCGWPRVAIGQGNILRVPKPIEMWWRYKGTSQWKAWGEGVPEGLCDIAWRDAQTKHIRAKMEAILLPASFEVQLRVDKGWATVSLKGWKGGARGNLGVRTQDGNWNFQCDQVSSSHFELTLTSTEYPHELNLLSPFQQRAWIYDWSGNKLKNKKGLTVAELSNYVARASGRKIDLWAELLDRNGKPVPQANARWTFNDEMPLSVVSDDLSALIGAAGIIDARVRLDFHDSYDQHWFVSEFTNKLVVEPRGFVSKTAIVNPSARIVARSLTNPTVEVDLEPYGEQELRNHRPVWPVIENGPSLVYVRANDRVITRPFLYENGALLSEPQDYLGREMVKADFDAALNAMVEGVVSDFNNSKSRSIVLSLIKLAESLNGLPPSTFHVFNRIGSYPLLGPLMLFGAGAHQIEDVIRLEDGLSFSWCLIPKKYWDEAWQIWGNYYASMFPLELQGIETLGIVAKQMKGKRDALITHVPELRPLLEGSSKSTPLSEIANTFLNRSHDRIRTDIVNPFRPLREGILQQWSFGRGYWRAADAPLVAASVARGDLDSELTPEELRAIKDVAHNHPNYFRDAYAAQFGA